jgi:SAM-dependent methyltransferase
MASQFPKMILDKTIEMAHPKTVLDLGCGVGRSLDYFISQGIDCFGIEGSCVAISKANNPDRILRFNLNEELDLKKKYDLIWSFEFVEHIHPKYINNLMKTFVNHSNLVIMSAAQPFQGGEGHFNMQPQSYWAEQFKRHGYELNIKKTERLRNIDEQFSKNMYVFERKGTGQHEF